MAAALVAADLYDEIGVLVRFALLGPVRVGEEIESREISGLMPRTLLAVLLLEAGAVVSVDRLSEALWGPNPPDSALASLHNHVMRLRRLLGKAGGGRIRAVSPGYVIDVEPGELDLQVFEELCSAARRSAAEERWAEASEQLSTALDLWHGQPLADVPGLEGHPRIEQMREARIQAQEEWVEAELLQGRHIEVIGDLRTLAAEHPLREGLHAQLMLALYRAGRQAEALEVFQKLRRTLVDELGVEPSVSAKQLQQRILSADPALASPEPGPGTVVAVTAAPPAADPGRNGPRHQLPADTRVFTGRAQELDQLLTLAGAKLPEGEGPGMVVISAIDGMAGVGKTALAVRAAHQLADRYPDGQLFIDLHGYTQSLAPREPADALASVLQAYGVTPRQLPADLDERAALYRKHLTGTRTLVLLDNVATEEQVRPLLPSSDGCLVLITSRRRLRALDEAHALALDVLPMADAVALFREVAGPSRAAADDPLLEEIAALCGCLPLALRISAALIRHRSAWTLGRLADRLRGGQPGLDQFFDGERDLTAVFDLSYDTLGDDQRTLFRRLGLVPGPTIDAYAAAALLDRGLTEVENLLRDLVDQNLLIESAPGRFQLHDLLRVYAHSRADRDDPPAAHEGAVDRLLDYYQYTTQQADRHLARYTPTSFNPAVSDPPRYLPQLDSRERADAWIAKELANLAAAAEHSAGRVRPTHAVALPGALHAYLRAHGPWTLAVALDKAAAEAARALGDRNGQANSINNLGIVLWTAGDYPGATLAHEEALELFRALGDKQGQAHALTNVGTVRERSGDHAGALRNHEEALELFRSLGDRQGQAAALTNLGNARWATGDHAGTTRDHEEALTLYQAVGDLQGQAGTLTNLGLMRWKAGDHSGAARAHEEALELFRASGSQNGHAIALTNLGRVLRETGDYPGATLAHEEALDLFRRLGDQRGQAHVLDDVGRLRRDTGDLPGAAEALRQALEKFRAIGDRSGEAEALNGCGQVCIAAGDLDEAREYHEQGLRLARDLGSPVHEADALAGLGEVCLRSAAGPSDGDGGAGGGDGEAGGGEAGGGEAGDGVEYLRQALEIYRKLGLPGAQRVEARLAELG